MYGWVAVKASEWQWRASRSWRYEVPLHPIDVQTMPCASISQCGYICTRTRGHTGSCMAGTQHATAAIWDSELEWDILHGWDRVQ